MKQLGRDVLKRRRRVDDGRMNVAGIHVEVGYIAGHLGSDSNGECTNLLMDVLHEGIGGPASLLFKTTQKEWLLWLQFSVEPHCALLRATLASNYTTSQLLLNN